MKMQRRQKTILLRRNAVVLNEMMRAAGEDIGNAIDQVFRPAATFVGAFARLASGRLPLESEEWRRLYVDGWYQAGDGPAVCSISGTKVRSR